MKTHIELTLVKNNTEVVTTLPIWSLLIAPPSKEGGLTRVNIGTDIYYAKESYGQVLSSLGNNVARPGSEARFRQIMKGNYKPTEPVISKGL